MTNFRTFLSYKRLKEIVINTKKNQISAKNFTITFQLDSLSFLGFSQENKALNSDKFVLHNDEREDKQVFFLKPDSTDVVIFTLKNESELFMTDTDSKVGMIVFDN